MHSCFTSCIFAARTLDLAVKFRLVFRYEAVVFRRYVLALLLVGLLRKFEAYLVYLSLTWTKNPRRFSFFQKFLHFTYMLLWFHLVIPSFPAWIDDMCSRFSAPLCRDLHILVPRDRAPFGQHQESRLLASTSGQVQHRKSAIHGLPVTLRMLRVKSDKSDWFWSQSIVFTNPFKTGMSLDLARGRDSWCWPKGARPLGTRSAVFRLSVRSSCMGVSEILEYQLKSKKSDKNTFLVLLFWWVLFKMRQARVPPPPGGGDGTPRIIWWRCAARLTQEYVFVVPRLRAGAQMYRLLCRDVSQWLWLIGSAWLWCYLP